ncbi:MAG: IPTL-CTERM sorting domain-containing protein [bacterium]|nr:IPTL-CTERM sorting domain-containing protein [bacterium]
MNGIRCVFAGMAAIAVIVCPGPALGFDWITIENAADVRFSPLDTRIVDCPPEGGLGDHFVLIEGIAKKPLVVAGFTILISDEDDINPDDTLIWFQGSSLPVKVGDNVRIFGKFRLHCGDDCAVDGVGFKWIKFSVNYGPFKLFCKGNWQRNTAHADAENEKEVELRFEKEHWGTNYGGWSDPRFSCEDVPPMPGHRADLTVTGVCEFPNDTCVDEIPQELCEAAGGEFVGDAAPCDLEEYCEPSIPTVSEWGLILMTLLLLTAGTVVIGRRRRPLPA